jgi:pimeloyl-ACP methyl ester carboxylesterase
MKASRSSMVDIRGLRYHVREWGHASAPKLFLLHGWMDVSASFQFTVDELQHEWCVIAPDWRGFGLSEWTNQGYWFPDYIADLDMILQRYSPDEPALIVGHSMGGNVANLYAGIRPERVGKVILAEGFGLPPTSPEDAPERYRGWLAGIREPPALRGYKTFDEVARRLQRNNPRLSDERARYLAPHWAEAQPDGSIRLRADPAHKMINPVLYRVEEAMACWRRTTAPLLWLWSDSEWMATLMAGNKALLDSYRACFSTLSEATIAGSSHMMHHDQPAAFARSIEAFMAPRQRGSARGPQAGP